MLSNKAQRLLSHRGGASSCCRPAPQACQLILRQELPVPTHLRSEPDCPLPLLDVHQCSVLGPLSCLCSLSLQAFWTGLYSSSFLSSFPTVCSYSYLSSAWVQKTLISFPLWPYATYYSKSYLPSAPATCLHKPGEYCLSTWSTMLVALTCPPSILALQIFPALLCLSNIITTPQATHLPLLIPSP